MGCFFSRYIVNYLNITGPNQMLYDESIQELPVDILIIIQTFITNYKCDIYYCNTLFLHNLEYDIKIWNIDDNLQSFSVIEICYQCRQWICPHCYDNFYNLCVECC